MTNVTVEGQTARIVFNQFDLDNYALFLRAKSLPQKQVTYDPDCDSYEFRCHRRFLPRLGLTNIEATERQGDLPISEFLFDYQKWIVGLALEAERFCIFATTGTGKTLMELEFGRHALHRLPGKALLLTLPKIIPQFLDEQRRFYPDMPLTHIKTREELIAWLNDGQEGFAITNYEKLIPPKKGVDGPIPEFRNLSCLICDESSVLKTGGGVIKWNLIKSARGIPYKLGATATPAPNDVKEYASQAAFLERIQGFWDFFAKRGDGKGDWYVKPHAKQAFYQFMASWSIYLRNPARYGFADNQSSIPAPIFHDLSIPATQEQMDFAMEIFAKAGAGMFGDRSLGIVARTKLSEAAKGFVLPKVVKSGPKNPIRYIASQKPYEVAHLVATAVREGRQVLCWTVFDEESELIEANLRDSFPDVVFATLHGNDKEAVQDANLEAFRRGKVPALISKAKLLGFGMNFQFVTAMVFSGVTDSYEAYFQQVRRAFRYGQTEHVQIHMPMVSELEGPIMENLMRKKANFEADADAMETAYLEVFNETCKV